MKKNFEKHTVPEKICIAFTVLLFTVYSITLIYPFVWGFLSSLKSGAIEYFDDPFGFPKEFHFENFRSAIELLEFNDIGFVDMVMNSLWFAAGSAVLSVLVTALCAYTFARYNFPFKNALYAFSIFIMMIPIYGSLPAQYKFFTQWGLRNSPRILVTALGAFGTSQFLIMTSYYRNLAKDYKDKAGDALIKEIQDHVKRVTAPYKYPRIVEFVDELPKTISGKIRRVEIRNKK